jgi:menaquinone-dependent protoporphyrinogen IX oxidase
MKKILSAILVLTVFSGVQAKAEKMKNILIVYASFKGSTLETAEFMKKELEGKKCNVTISSAGLSKDDISEFDLIILGSAIQGAKIHPDMTSYIDKNREALKKKKTAVFIMCATITSEKKKTREKAELYPDQVATGFTPVSKIVFGGMITPPKNRFEKFMAGWFLGIEKFGDFRNWDKIRKWVTGLI